MKSKIIEYLIREDSKWFTLTKEEFDHGGRESNASKIKAMVQKKASCIYMIDDAHGSVFKIGKSETGSRVLSYFEGNQEPLSDKLGPSRDPNQPLASYSIHILPMDCSRQYAAGAAAFAEFIIGCVLRYHGLEIPSEALLKHTMTKGSGSTHKRYSSDDSDDSNDSDDSDDSKYVDETGPKERVQEGNDDNLVSSDILYAIAEGDNMDVEGQEGDIVACTTDSESANLLLDKYAGDNIILDQCARERERKRDEARKALQKRENEKHKRKCEAVDRASRELERKKTADEELLKIIWNEVKVSLQEVATGHEAADLTRRVSDVKEASKYGLSWLKSFKLLLQYYEEYGHCNGKYQNGRH